jgi:cytochrome bd ubiquinol oxidase subunit II
MYPIIAYLIAGTLLGAYIVASSIEFGSALLVAFPRLLGDRGAVRRYFGPVWEATHVLLIFAVVAVITSFPKAIPLFAVNLLPVINVAIVFFGVRVLGILALFYAQWEGWFWKLLFLIGSVGAPVTLSLAYVFCITGTLIPMYTFWLLIGVCILVLSAIGLLSSTFFVYFVGGRLPSPRLLHVASDCAHLFLVGAFLFVYGLMDEAPYMFGQSNLMLLAVIGAALPSLLVQYFHGVRYWGAACISAVVGVLGLFLSMALAHAPYLIFPYMRLADAFTSPEVFSIMLGALGIGLLAVVPAFVLLYRLFARSGRHA